MYNINNIYNADETGLFFQMAPNQTLARSASAGKKLVSGILCIIKHVHTIKHVEHSIIGQIVCYHTSCCKCQQHT